MNAISLAVSVCTAISNSRIYNTTSTLSYDPYDDDMYEGQDIPEKLQAICDNLDITLRIEAGLVYVGLRGMAFGLVNRVGLKMEKQELVGPRVGFRIVGDAVVRGLQRSFTTKHSL
ncbi:hypothetical protein Tco_0831060, partial [Tanacetum coccineum]